jgi:hypothetical protein
MQIRYIQVMPGLFDEFARSFSSDDEDETSHDGVAQAVVDSLDEDDIDEELREAEKLLAKAAYYKAIVRNGVIEDDGTTQSTEVNAEARVWARQQMGKMLGRHQEPAKVEPQFTENEVRALKKLAGFALAKMGELPAEPVVKTVAAQPPTPTVRKVAAQPPAQPKRVQADTAKPKAAPAPAGPVAKAGKTKAPRVKKDAAGEPDYDSVPSGTPFKDVDGTMCKFVDNPNYDPGREGSRPRTKLKIQGQVRAVSGGFPPPTKDQLTMLSQVQAMETIGSGTSASATSPFGYDKDASTDIFVAAAAKSLT